MLCSLSRFDGTLGEPYSWERLDHNGNQFLGGRLIEFDYLTGFWRQFAEV